MKSNKKMRRTTALLVSFLMIFTLFGIFSAQTFAAEKTGKFGVQVSSKNSSGTSGTVTGTVYDDFSGELVISAGNVNTSNASFYVWMENVASLGVTGKREYNRSFQFSDEGKDVSLNSVMNTFSPLDGTKIHATSGDASMTYTITKANEEGSLYTLTPDSEEAARALWHQMVSEENLEAGTKADEDSYIVIANGSNLQIGDTVLQFEDSYEGDLKVDDLGDLAALNQNIRKAVELAEADPIDGIQFTLKAGTELAMGQSYAKLLRDAVVTVNGEGLAELDEYLYQLRDNQPGDTEEGILALYRMLQSGIEKVGGGEFSVDVDFVTEKAEKFGIEVSSKNSSGTSGTVTGKVFADYTGELAISSGQVNTSNVAFKVWMENVASLGVDGRREYSRDFQFSDEGKDVSLKSVMNTFSPLDGTKIHATSGDASMTYTIAKANEEGSLYTLTPDSEEAARTLWHTIVNEQYLESGTKSKDDSSITIANGSELHIGDTLLKFEEGCDSDLILDNLGDLAALNDNIREKVTLTDAEMYDGIAITLRAGTELNMGQSYVKLLQDAFITVEGEGLADLDEYLYQLRDNQPGDTEEGILALYRMLQSAIEQVGGKEISVEVAYVTDEPSEDDPHEYLQQQIDELRAQIDELRDQIAELQAQIDTNREAIEALQEASVSDEDVQKAIEEAVAAVEEAQKTINETQKAINDAQKAINEAQKQIDEAQDAQVAALADEVEKLNKALEEAKAAATDANVASLEAAKAYTDLEVGKLQDQINALKAEMAQNSIDSVATSLKATSENYNTAKATWNTSKISVGGSKVVYTLYGKTAEEEQWSKIYEAECAGDGKAMEYSATDLKTSSTYQFKVIPSLSVDGKVYEGSESITESVKVVLGKVKLGKVKGKKKKINVRWKAVEGAEGYSISYKDGKKKAKTANVKAVKLSKVLKKLKSKHKYTIKVRAYRTVDGSKVYGAWSKAKKVKAK